MLNLREVPGIFYSGIFWQIPLWESIKQHDSGSRISEKALDTTKLQLLQQIISDSYHKRYILLLLIKYYSYRSRLRHLDRSYSCCASTSISLDILRFRSPSSS